MKGDIKQKIRFTVKKKSDYAMVRKGDRVIGHLQFSAPRFGSGDWELTAEERK